MSLYYNLEPDIDFIIKYTLSDCLVYMTSLLSQSNKTSGGSRGELPLTISLEPLLNTSSRVKLKPTVLKIRQISLKIIIVNDNFN